MGNFYVLVDISKTIASKLAYKIGLFSHNVLLIANEVVVLNLSGKKLLELKLALFYGCISCEAKLMADLMCWFIIVANCVT